MNDAPTPHVLAAVIVLAAGAVALSGLGGMTPEGQLRVLFGAGAAFCVLMLFVPGVFFMSGRSLSTGSGAAAACGVLIGVCANLYFVSDGRLSGLIGYAVGGGVGGYVFYWIGILRQGRLWLDA